ncbi:50S ribosomal protein L4 [Thermomicrobiaceae bacterium CFH 74404]|uniref:Large ribosomal subunit protein uL4 n=1 Tax=Thermalbibacter longus TaxID=2951981 RepID=A0AA41WGB9_9BACT|nr:50S ribosomal protein L4 [Thermalbibacter longus]MCM8750578.1 50S ribosomal protein L4 [Thermalbibacter longus]
MQVAVFDLQGQQVGQIELADSVFGIQPHVPVMHQALVRQLANARAGTHDTKTRGEVRGGGRKPWRQKGTGRARQGSIRAPHWKGGGVVWGPHPRKYTKDMPKKMRRLAIRSVLSAKQRENQIVVVEGLSEIEPRTKAMKAVLSRLPLSDARSTIVVVDRPRDNVYRSAGNLENVKVLMAQYMNVRDGLKYERMILMREAVDEIHRLWAQEGQ